jgi:hypothetical protein
VRARALEGLGNLGAVGGAVAARMTVGHAQLAHHRHVLAHGIEHPLQHHDRKAHAPLDAAAIGVAPPVVQWTEKLTEQITVPHVNLNRVEACGARQLRAAYEFGGHPLHVGAGHLLAQPLAAHDADLVESATR